MAGDVMDLLQAGQADVMTSVHTHARTQSGTPLVNSLNDHSVARHGEGEAPANYRLAPRVQHNLH